MCNLIMVLRDKRNISPKYSHHGHLCNTSSCDNADVNECAVNNGGCSPVAACINTPGSSTCTCLPGYTGDGVNCTGEWH